MTIYLKPYWTEVSECDEDHWALVDIKWPIKTFNHWAEVNVRNLDFVDPDEMVWTADITICLPSFDLEQRLYVFIDGAVLSTERGLAIFADHNGPVRLRLVEGDDDTLLAESMTDDFYFETLVDMNEAVRECVKLTEESYGDY
jgi:hypothetical protein